MLNSQIEAFKKWKSDLLPEEEKKLTKEGKRELLELGERMQGRFPDLLPPVYSNTSYKVNINSSSFSFFNSLTFSLNILIHNEQKKVQKLLLLVYLERKLQKMSGIQKQ